MYLGTMMEEQAKEELEMLESQYPNHFEYLKLELKSFIFQLQPQKPHHSENTTTLTQESTSLSLRKRKKSTEGGSQSDPCEHYAVRMKKGKRRDRVDVVLERAEACLKKIQHLKTSGLSDEDRNVLPKMP